MQYFVGYSSFCDVAAFDPSLFVELRKRLGIDQINSINEDIVRFFLKKSTEISSAVGVKNGSVPVDKMQNAEEKEHPSSKEDNSDIANASEDCNSNEPIAVSNQGKMIIDATVCPQDIAYPTDLNLLNDAREKAEELIDLLYNPILHVKKPRTYRYKARKLYLSEAQKKRSSAKSIRKSNKQQLAFLRRDIRIIHCLLDKYPKIPLKRKEYKYLLVIQTVYQQQEEMYRNKIHSIEHRIVSIHQPHVRPIVRGKRNAKVEFGAKIQVSLMNGFVFLDDLDWEAFNEGSRLKASVEKYKERFGYYPAEVLADKIYCTRDNRNLLKGISIKLRAKPLGRPSLSSAVEDHVRPGERNPIEGVFGQAKTAYGMNRIKARLAQTSESWIATILMVINLVKITGLIRHVLILYASVMTFSAYCFVFIKFLQSYILRKNYSRLAIKTATAA
jgi:hypothetical protein